ncbi:hypothetical protein BS47DRAFT_1389511 [Hydnum rufescens UP504]|uniref:Uncharacterized protein n=1 Tax=Hydnum rufescens UP504 TaxID=1448309 RepID=A0A9P6E095_9AGAM|nr:hypothetical protein BS47DRAFT_1389511 [Hydnum rufescens UP504]
MPKRLRESDGLSKLPDTLKRDAKEFARFIDSNSRDARRSQQSITPVKQKGTLLQPSPSTLLPSKKPLQPIPDAFAFLPISSHPAGAFESPKTRSTPRMPPSHPHRKPGSSTDPKVTPKRVLPVPPPPTSTPGWRDNVLTSSRTLVTPSTTRVVERLEFGSFHASGSCATDLGEFHPQADGADGETARGLEIGSPKDWREPGRSGFIRNGLAERASSLIETSEIRFALWHAETLRSGTTAPLPLTNKPKPFAVPHLPRSQTIEVHGRSSRRAFPHRQYYYE